MDEGGFEGTMLPFRRSPTSYRLLIDGSRRAATTKNPGKSESPFANLGTAHPWSLAGADLARA